MNRDSNSYTFIFSIIMVVVAAGGLAFTATSLKERQEVNIRNEKMQNILSTVGISVSREMAQSHFDKHILEQISLNSRSEDDKSVKAFDINLENEIRKPVEEQHFPLYVAQVEDKKYYIIPLRGQGLWDAIWGYISLEDDLNTVRGVVFDHKGETAGLGGDINQPWFQDRFAKETIFDKDGNFIGVKVTKGNNDPKGEDKTDHEVDAISGATITSNGVSNMIAERLSHYVDYIKKMRSAQK